MQVWESGKHLPSYGKRNLAEGEQLAGFGRVNANALVDEEVHRERCYGDLRSTIALLNITGAEIPPRLTHKRFVRRSRIHSGIVSRMDLGHL
jgi:hypothetical protein